MTKDEYEEHRKIVLAAFQEAERLRRKANKELLFLRIISPIAVLICAAVTAWIWQQHTVLGYVAALLNFASCVLNLSSTHHVYLNLKWISPLDKPDV